jgi:hypothetical protein
LAWQSIERDGETLNLDAFQRNQAKTKHEEADTTVTQRMTETYFWILSPAEKKREDSEQTAIEWSEGKASGQESLAARASKKLKADGALITNWAGSLLKIDLDRVPLWRGNQVPVLQLADDFAKYLYLPRLRDTDVLIEAIKDGVALLSWDKDSFAYADSWDEANKRYVGLKYAKRLTITTDSTGLLVRAIAAKAQTNAEAAREPSSTTTTEPADASTDRAGDDKPLSEATQRLLTRFHATASLNSIRVSRDAGQIAAEVVQHLTKLPGATVEVTIEIQSQIPNGAPDDVVRTISENCRTLKFRNFDFEEE